ncbi:MAG: hypothetical protein ACTHL8_08135 [Burkholderiaceae bacterium]
MNPNDGTVLACSGLPAADRCADTLPDSPQCALNYHFGMLLGVDDFRAEQGFHVGRLRRHQRLLHGAGVVAGYPITYDTTSFDLAVGPGYAIDVLGRDLWLDARRCVNLAQWWRKHSADDEFAALDPADATVDLDIRLCYATCLDRAVPAIAEPCAGDAADVAYSRLCETVSLAIVKHVDPAPVAPSAQPAHLLRLWLGLDPAAVDAHGQLLPDDQWLGDRVDAIEALPFEQQAPARAALLREVTARAVAAIDPGAPELDDDADACIVLGTLRQVHFTRDADGWHVGVGGGGAVDPGGRPTLLSTSVLQALALADPPAVPVPAGPIVVLDGAHLSGTDVTLTFSQPLAAASVTPQAFAIGEFDDAHGWRAFTIVAATIDTTHPERPVVTLALDRAPTGAILRITVVGDGPAPLLGGRWIPAGARRADGDGRNLTTTLTL